MEDKVDQAKGRFKQAAGDLSGDRDLRREGRTDEMAGKAKGMVEKMKDGLNGLMGRFKGSKDRTRQR